MDLPLSVAIDYIVYAVEQEKDQAAWELWSGMYPFMTKETFIKFDDFKRKLFQPQYRYTQKPLEEIEQEILAVVAKHRGR